MSDPEQPAMPPGMSLPVLPQAPQPVSGIEGGLQGVARVADTVGGAVQMATQVSQAAQGISSDQLVSQVAGGAGMALGGAASFVSGIDPGVSQALGVVSAGVSAFGGVVGMVRSAVDAIEGAVSEANRHRVTFEFESAATPTTAWMVGSFTIDERMGRPYIATAVLAVEDLDTDPRPLLGVGAKLTLRRGADHERVFGGIVRRVELGKTTDRARVVTIEIVPALALLALRKDSRIFQDLDAVEILDAVVGGALEGYSREIEMRVRRNYPRREHCVQYGETDLDFATRLMEEEGITYFFEWSSDGVEKVIFVDGRDGMPSLLPDDERIPFVQQRGETSDTEHIHELVLAKQMQTTSFALSDLDWTQVRPAAVIEESVHGTDDNGLSRERYDHDRSVSYGRYEQKSYLRSDAAARLATRREAHAVRELELRGTANVLRLTPGRIIDVEDHPIAALDGQLLVLAVTHRGHAPELHDLIGQQRYGADDVSYECTFEAIPEHVPFRMLEATPKPRVHGVLSAIVVGASGQEIHSDEHRRVRIQMRWDREGTFDERSSPFVRVMQSWAGSGFGMVFLPRVGMEVAVAFLDGDPDRPMIAGCLYNAECEPPYKTAEEWTKSGIRTRSSPNAGATHGNELTFDDAAGAEQIFLHAQMDLDEHVEHDHSTHVERDQTNTVDRDQAVHVHHDRRVGVGRDEAVHVGRHRTTNVDHDDTFRVGGVLREEVVGEAHQTYQNVRKLYVGEAARESYRGGRDVYTNQWERKTVQGDSNQFVHGRSDLEVDQHHRIKKGATQLVVADGVVASSDGHDITLMVGENRIAISPNGDIRIHGSQIFLSTGAASIAMTSDGSVSINGPGGVNLACGQSSVELTPMGVTTSGTQVSSNATADHTITGMIVRIN